MFDLDAIDACLFRNKVKVLFLFLKLKMVSREDLQKRSDAIEAKHKIKIFDPEILKNIDEFTIAYKKRIAMIQAKKLQELTFYDQDVKATKIYAKIPSHVFKDIVQNYYFK